jgi:hypothetical protein
LCIANKTTASPPLCVRSPQDGRQQQRPLHGRRRRCPGWRLLLHAPGRDAHGTGRQRAALGRGEQDPRLDGTGGDQGFLSLKLDKSEIVNHNTKKLTFLLPEGDMESGLHVASAVITKYKGPEMEKPVIRPYTPTSDVDQRGTVEFLIKKYPNGPMSTHLHDMEPGQRLEIKGPIPKYQWAPNKVGSSLHMYHV